MSRRVLTQALLGGAALVCVAAVVEIAAYVHRGLVCPGSAPTFAVPSRFFGWTHPASTTVHAYGCAGTAYEWSTSATFNSLGLNSAEHSYLPAPNVLRVLVLGDSATEALQVERPQSFSEQLQVMLRGDGRQVEVINAGHSGYGTDNELLFLQNEGIRYRPDVVLLAFNLQNDIAENSPAIVAKMYAGGPRHPKADVRLGPDGKLVIDTSPYKRFAEAWKDHGWAMQPPMPWLRDNSFFVRRLYNILVADRIEPASQPGTAYPTHLDVYRSADTPDWAQAWDLTSALVRELHRITQDSGARLLVAVIPTHETTDPVQWSKLVQLFPALAGETWDLDLPRRRILDLLSAQDIDAVDTTATFRLRHSEAGDSGFFDFDPHPNAAGHRWIAETVLPALERELDAAVAAPQTSRRE